MDFWEGLQLRLVKANFDEHAKNMRDNMFGTQIYVPNQYNNNVPTSKELQDLVPRLAMSHGMQGIHQVPSIGGWTASIERVGDLPASQRLQVEPITVHRAYSDNPITHAAMRDIVLPHIQKNLDQDSSLGITNAANGQVMQGKLPPFRLHTLRARIPVSTDPQDKTNIPYQDMLGRIADKNGGFTHFQMPGENQIQVYGHANDLAETQKMMHDFFKKHYGVQGSFSHSPAHAVLYSRPKETSLLTSKTASLDKRHEENHHAVARNIIQVMIKSAQLGDMDAVAHLKRLGLT